MFNNVVNLTYAMVSKWYNDLITIPLIRKKSIILRETFATLSGVIPNSLLWFYKRKLSKGISCTRIDHPHRRPAYLYRHRTLQKETNTPVLLLLHGYNSHPSTLLHFAEAAAESYDGEIFSLQLPYDDIKPEAHKFLVTKALDEIFNLFSQRHKNFNGVIAAGHSRGAIELCYQAYIAGEQRIKGIISIAGRLRIVESHDKQCVDALKPYIHKIHEAIQQKPEIPLYQIIAEMDWNAPLEETQVRKLTSHIVPNALHLNVLFHQETIHKFKEFLKILSSA